ncbi:type IV toxin-antitoxin system AbiEi family antitoxin domain-containing protein [Paenibacillus medicaginis]|uniref:AbiEi antitoxin C-terminal domain-containing protein n=1 Tax=Paenibacillus medicaginis TaxID=1470560 RepID=A0ABV5C1M8_9BACL
MGRPNRFQIMELYQNDIIAALKGHGKKILNFEEINGTLLKNGNEWRLPKTTTAHDLLDFLVHQKKILREVNVFGNSRYVFKNKQVTPTEFALSLHSNLYLSHYSAVSFHDLTNEIVKSIYVNKEQTKKAGSDVPHEELIQENIDKAFSKPMRKTRSFFEVEGQRIYVLNGRYTNRLGVKEINGVAVTDLERTLIDIAVRPDYAGGVYEVVSIYKRAKGQISANKLRMYLQKLNYIYPYHQTIGFYLECAGFNEIALRIMESFPMKNDFYLTYSIPDREYSERWRLYYPKYFEN